MLPLVPSHQSSRAARRRPGGKRSGERFRPRDRSWRSMLGSRFFGQDRWRQIGTTRGMETSRKLYNETDVICCMLIFCFYTGFLWCGFWEWSFVVLQTCFIASAFESLIPSTAFERFLPHHIAVWFEEATVVIEDTGYQAYSKPFVRFGNTILLVTFKTVWYCVIQRRTGWENNIILYAADLGIQQCLLMRQWRRTSEQYLRKLRLRLQSSCADRVVRDEALKVLRAAEEDRMFWGYRFLPLEDMKATAEMLTQGTPRCIDFLHEALEKVMRSPDLEHDLPLFKQWQQLKVTQQAVERVLALRESCGDAEGERWIVTGARRQQVAGRLKQAPRCESMFHDLAKTVDGGSADTLAALVELDRRASRRRRAADVVPTPTEVEAPAAPFADVEPPLSSGCFAPDAKPSRQEQSLECICCFDRPAEIVFAGCGHLAYCKGCRRKALKQGHLAPAPGGIRSYARLLRRRLACPLCRQESRTVELCDFNGFVFSP